MLPAKEIVIKEINIIRFGKLENLVIKPADGVNVIYGENESGKSTIQLFLKAMLFGMPTRKKSGETLKERERAIPWSGGKAEGILTLCVKGRDIEIRRKFGKTSAGDKFEVCDAHSGQVLADYTEDTLGENVLGITEGLFEKTLWISQNGAFMGGKDDDLSKRLFNLQTGGDETVSVSAALTKIEAEKRSIEAKDKRNLKGKLDILKERLNKCRAERYDLSTQLAQSESTKRQLIAAKSELEKTEANILALEEEYKKSFDKERTFAIRGRISQIDECDKKINLIYNNSSYQKGKDLTGTKVKEAAELERRISVMESELAAITADEDAEDTFVDKQQKGSIITGAGAGLILMGLVGAIAFGVSAMPATMGIFLMLFICGVIALITGIKLSAVAKHLIQKSRMEQSDADNIRRKLETEIREKCDELKEILSSFGVADVYALSDLYTSCAGMTESIESLKSAKLAFLGDDTYEELSKMADIKTDEDIRPVAEIEEHLKNQRNLQIELLTKVRDLDSKMAYDVKIKALPSDIDTEIAGINDEISKYQRRLLVLSEAEKSIKEAGENWKSGNLPQLSEKVNKFIGVLTKNKYMGTRVTDDYRVRVNSGSDLFDAEYLSYGTYEQMYLALRLSIAELLCRGRLFFLDDILISYDDERTEAALRLFSSLAADWQVFLFTCRCSDMEKATQFGANIINI